MRRTVSGIAIPLLVLGALAACTATNGAPSASPSSPRVDATATPTPNPLSEPASQLPGDCADFLATTVAAGVLDAAITSSESRDTRSDARTIDRVSDRQSGDLVCSWDTATPSLSLYLEVRRNAAVLAADPLGWWKVTGSVSGVDADHAEATCTDVPTAGGNCEIDAALGDYWVDLSVLTPAGVSSSAKKSAAIDAMARVLDRLRSEPVPALWQRPAGAWPGNVDCAALGAHADVAIAMGLAGVTVADTTRSGEDFQLSDAVARLGGASQCTWSTPEGLVAELDLTAGGGWVLSSTDAESTPVSIAGADIARLTCSAHDNSLCSIAARVGVDLAIVTGSNLDDRPTTAQLTAMAAAIIAGLRAVHG
ncbi:MAG TPA: hypothetical protein VGM38_06600 [Pseudolysinimonas sp.]|jgi:hypothetical protein